MGLIDELENKKHAPVSPAPANTPAATPAAPTNTPAMPTAMPTASLAVNKTPAEIYAEKVAAEMAAGAVPASVTVETGALNQAATQATAQPVPQATTQAPAQAPAQAYPQQQSATQSFGSAPYKKQSALAQLSNTGVLTEQVVTFQSQVQELQARASRGELNQEQYQIQYNILVEQEQYRQQAAAQEVGGVVESHYAEDRAFLNRPEMYDTSATLNQYNEFYHKPVIRLLILALILLSLGGAGYFIYNTITADDDLKYSEQYVPKEEDVKTGKSEAQKIAEGDATVLKPNLDSVQASKVEYDMSKQNIYGSEYAQAGKIRNIVIKPANENIPQLSLFWETHIEYLPASDELLVFARYKFDNQVNQCSLQFGDGGSLPTYTFGLLEDNDGMYCDFKISMAEIRKTQNVFDRYGPYMYLYSFYNNKALGKLGLAAMTPNGFEISKEFINGNLLYNSPITR